jgi:hypothetical protein
MYAVAKREIRLFEGSQKKFWADDIEWTWTRVQALRTSVEDASSYIRAEPHHWNIELVKTWLFTPGTWNSATLSRIRDQKGINRTPTNQTPEWDLPGLLSIRIRVGQEGRSMDLLCVVWCYAPLKLCLLYDRCLFFPIICFRHDFLTLSSRKSFSVFPLIQMYRFPVFLYFLES